MIVVDWAADPRIHELAGAIARRFVGMIGSLLRDEEVGDAMREAYQIAREEIEAHGRNTSDAAR